MPDTWQILEEVDIMTRFPRVWFFHMRPRVGDISLEHLTNRVI